MDIIKHYQIVFDSPIFWLYATAVIVDLILGNVKAFKNGDIDSNVGVRGSLKHAGLASFVILFLPTLSVYLGDSTVSNSIVVYFVYQYAISIIENLGAMGFPLPDSITEKFRRLGADEYDSEGKRKGDK